MKKAWSLSLTLLIGLIMCSGISAFAYENTSNYNDPSGSGSTTYYVTYRDIEFYVGGNSATVIEYLGTQPELEIPSTVEGKPVTSISWSAFNSNTVLTKVVIPNGVTVISGYAFESCYNLKEVVIPESVTYIDGCAFYNCTSLTNINIPEGVKSIFCEAFYGCTGLTSIVLPHSLTFVDKHAFRNCTNLTDIYYNGSETEFNERVSLDTCRGFDSNSPGGTYPMDSLTGATFHYHTDHIYSQYEVYQPTCQNEGFTVYKCIICEAKYISDYVEKLQHEFEFVKAIKHSDTEKGYSIFKCTECGDECIDDYVAAGHNYVPIKVVKPTCTECGFTINACTVCGELCASDYTPIDSTRHDYIAGETVASTCTERGYTVYTCADCGAQMQGNYAPLEPHYYTLVQTEHGIINSVCLVCGNDRTDDFAQYINSGNRFYDINRDGNVNVRDYSIISGNDNS